MQIEEQRATQSLYFVVAYRPRFESVIKRLDLDALIARLDTFLTPKETKIPPSVHSVFASNKEFCCDLLLGAEWQAKKGKEQGKDIAEIYTRIVGLVRVGVRLVPCW